MSVENFDSWLSAQDSAVRLEDAMAKGEEIGLRSFETSQVLRDKMEEDNLKGGYLSKGGEVERVGFVGSDSDSVSRAIQAYEQANNEEVSQEISWVNEFLGPFNELHDEYQNNDTTGRPYGDFSHEDVENFGDQAVEILLGYGEELLGMESTPSPDIDYKEKDTFTGGHGNIGYTRGDGKSSVEDLEDLFDLDIISAIPTPVQLLHEAGHIATEELAKRQYEADGNDDELGNYVSGYLDENSEEAANELMMYTWSQASPEEREILSAGADENKFESGIESYLEMTKHRSPEYRDQHPIEGTENSVSSMYN